MTPSRKHVAVLFAALAAVAATVLSDHAQPPASIPTAPRPAGSMNHNLIVLDPAHGGPDPGATLGDHVLEKDVVLAFSARLRTALVAAGFTVVTTRDADPTDTLTGDQRAELANRPHAVACLVLHATPTGSGVHIYTSTLQHTAESDADTDAPAFVPVPWDMAQAASVPQSLRLQSDLGTALAKANLPAVTGQAPVRPLDNLICPAVAIELAPLILAGADTAPLTDSDYQQRVTTALVSALQTWRGHAEPTTPRASTLAPTPTSAPNKTLSVTQAKAAAAAIAAANAAGLAAARARTQTAAGDQPGNRAANTAPTSPVQKETQ